jgi:7-carboxy-7-deazaguanine synthase
MIDSLRINEIFVSIQGETSFAGWPTVFVRTTGCPLRCTWCDTTYAFHDGTDRLLPDIVKQVFSYGVKHVVVTGGEPLAQKTTPELLKLLCEGGKTLLLETSGAIDISKVDDRVHIIMDIKCPDSRMTDRMRMGNIALLKAKDEVKFVLASRTDYEFARQTINAHNLADRCTVLLSTALGLVDPASVVGWMLEDQLPVRFQLQMHKFIWAPEQRGV